MILDIAKVSLDLIECAEYDVVIDLWTQHKALPFLSIGYPKTGYYEAALDGRPLERLDDGCYIVPANTFHTLVHHFAEDGSCMHPQWAFLRILYHNAIDLTSFIKPPFLLHGPQAMPFVHTIQSLLELNRHPNTMQVHFRRLELSYHLMELLLEASEFDIAPSGFDEIQPALKKMEKQYATRLSVEELAEACGLSAATFATRFKKLTGKTPIAYLMDKRLSYAAALLLQGPAPLAEIAQRTGFYDEFYFSRMFKKKYGVSPRQYKKGVSLQETDDEKSLLL